MRNLETESGYQIIVKFNIFCTWLTR